MTTTEDLISAREAAQLLDVSPRTVLRYHETGNFGAVRLSRRNFKYIKSEIIRFRENSYCLQLELF